MAVRLKVKATRLGHWDHALRHPGAIFVLNHEGEFSEEWMKPIGWTPKSEEERKKIALAHGKPKVEVEEDDEDFDEGGEESEAEDDDEDSDDDDDEPPPPKKAKKKKSGKERLAAGEPVAPSELGDDAVQPSTGDKDVI